MSGGLHIADFLILALWVTRLYPFINPGWIQLYNSTPSFTNLHLAGSMHQSGLLQREGKASLRIFQGRAYGGCV